MESTPARSQILIGLESAIPFLLLQTSTSFIDFILNWHHVFPTSLVVYCIPTPVIRGQVGHRIRGGVLSGRSLNRGGLLVHPLHVCASILPVSESPSSTSSRSCYHRVLQEKTTAPSTESSVSPTSIKETCQYEPPSPQTPPPDHNHHDSRPNNISHSHGVGRSAAGHRDQPLPSEH